MSRNKTSRKGSKARVVLIVLDIILALLLAVLVGGLIYVEKTLGSINTFEPDSTLSSEEVSNMLASEAFAETFAGELGTEPIEWNLVENEDDLVGQSEEIINILLIGQDTRIEGQRGLTDSMILCTVNTQTKKLVMTSFLRDMWVKIPGKTGYYSERLNTAYPTGGLERLNETLRINFGVTVDHNIEIDFSGFVEIVDALGGIDVELSAAEANIINKEAWMTVIEAKLDNSDYEKNQLSEGLNHLNGVEALTYARIRKIDTDFYRTGRQRVVMEKLLEKVKTMSLKEANDLVNAFVPLVTTDMSKSDIAGYVVELLPMLSELELVSQRIPAGDAPSLDGYYYYTNKGTEEDPKYVIIPNLELNRELLRDAIGANTD